MTDTTPPSHGHGALNPLAASRATGDAWEFAEGLWAWMDTTTGDVYFQGVDGDVTVPAAKLALLGRSLLAAHVQNGRAEFKAQP